MVNQATPGAVANTHTSNKYKKTATIIARTERQVHSGQETEKFIDQVISVFSSMDCDNIFGNLIGQNQQNQRRLINDFQKKLQESLNESFNLSVSDKQIWEIEALASSECRDSFDLFIETVLDGLSYKVVIELDKNRADQIAKKFLSRTSHTIDKPVIYFAFCYPGTDSMNVIEAIKYFKYCLNISNKMSSNETPKKFVGIVVEKNNCG